MQRGREALHLAWTAPASDGGADVHAYRLEQQQGAACCSRVWPCRAVSKAEGCCTWPRLRLQL